MSELPEDLSGPSVVHMSNAPEWQEVPADVQEKANKLQSLIAADIAQQKFFLAAIRAEAHRAGMLAGLKEAAGLAYSKPAYVRGFELDEHAQLKPGSPYDRGRYDARAAIRARIAEIEAEDNAP